MIKFVGNTPLVESTFATATIEEVLGWVHDNNIIGIDTETIGDCWTGHIYTLQFGNKDVQYVIDATAYSPKLFKGLLERPDKLFIGQNIKYDLKFLLALGIKPKNIYDTFIAECILTTGLEERELGLAAIAKKYCGAELDKTIRGKINYVGLTDEVIQYAAMDVEFLEIIMNKQYEELERWALVNLVQLENNVTKVFAEIEYTGMKLDPIKWIAQAEDREKQAHQYEDDLNAYILGNPDKFSAWFDNQLDLFSEGTKLRKINWNSSGQVIAIFAKEGFYTDSVNEKIIEKYRNKFPLVDLYLKYKENQTSISKFGRNYLRWINKKTNRIHTSYWQILATGRVSSGQKDITPNMQQLPALNEVRNCFISEEGYSFVDCDYSAMELVISGYVSGEESWIDAFKNGLDLHSVVAAAVYKDKWVEGEGDTCCYYNKIYYEEKQNKYLTVENYKNQKPEGNWKLIGPKQKCNCKEHKKMRDKTKVLNYLCIYGGGPQKLSDSINIPIDEAKQTVKSYFKGLPKLTAFLTKLKRFGVANGYITTKSPYGRIRWFAPHNGDPKLIGNIERQSGNTFVQGTGADVTKLAMVKMYDYKEEHNLDVKFVLQLHDAIVCEVPDSLAQEWKKIQLDFMIEAFEDVIGHPIDVDGYISKFWKK